MSHKSDKIIIELFGIPGVGKSTLSRRLEAEYGFTHVTATHVTRFEYIKLLWLYPVAVLFWLWPIVRNFTVTPRVRYFRYNISLLFVALKKNYLAKKSDKKKIVIDEGLLQRFLSYSDVVHSERLIKTLCKVSLLGSAIIHVNDREVVKDRYDEAHDRGSLGEEYLKGWRQNMAKNVATVDETLRTAFPEKFHATKAESINAILQHIPQP